MYAEAATGVIPLPLEEPMRFRRVGGSKFQIKSSSDSPGIQAIDIVLWLFKRILQGEKLPFNSSRLMDFVFKHGYQNDLSFEGVGSGLEQMVEDINNKPFTKEDEARGKEMLEFAEKRRLKAMEEYQKNKQ